MTSPTPTSEAATVQWDGNELLVVVGGRSWRVTDGELDAVLHLLQAGRALRAKPSDQVSPPEPERAAVPSAQPNGKRRSRKRVGDALIVWMEENSGWHHEDTLLSVVIENQMTDASPLRALKIALGKQRGTIFTDGGHGYWKLASDTTAGSLPEPTPTPTVRQRILARARGATKDPESKGGAPPEFEAEAAAGVDARRSTPAKADRWSDVSSDEAIARARRKLLGLGHNS